MYWEQAFPVGASEIIDSMVYSRPDSPVCIEIVPQGTDIRLELEVAVIKLEADFVLKDSSDKSRGLADKPVIYFRGWVWNGFGLLQQGTVLSGSFEDYDSDEKTLTPCDIYTVESAAMEDLPDEVGSYRLIYRGHDEEVEGEPFTRRRVHG